LSEEGIPEIRTLGTRLIVRLMHAAFFVTRGMTMGVRAACFDEKGRVFLVRHTYVPGWYLPGGGMERHETALQAITKEIREEGNLQAVSKPELFQVYFNNRASKRDHVILYRMDVFQTAPKKPDREIAESGFFDLNDLPKETTSATHRRLKELCGEVPAADHW
jgi:ADP-ribose pyrophosphatase YjhB (NUDIX family)